MHVSFRRRLPTTAPIRPLRASVRPLAGSRAPSRSCRRASSSRCRGRRSRVRRSDPRTPIRPSRAGSRAPRSGAGPRPGFSSSRGPCRRPHGRGVVLGRHRVLGLGTIGVGLGSFRGSPSAAPASASARGVDAAAGVIREHTPLASSPGERTLQGRRGLSDLPGPFVAGVVGRDGEGIFLALIGATAVALGARSSGAPAFDR